MPANNILPLLIFFIPLIQILSRFLAWMSIVSLTFNKAAPKSNPFLTTLDPDSANTMPVWRLPDLLTWIFAWLGFKIIPALLPTPKAGIQDKHPRDALPAWYVSLCVLWLVLHLVGCNSFRIGLAFSSHDLRVLASPSNVVTDLLSDLEATHLPALIIWKRSYSSVEVDVGWGPLGASARQNLVLGSLSGRPSSATECSRADRAA